MSKYILALLGAFFLSNVADAGDSELGNIVPPYCFEIDKSKIGQFGPDNLKLGLDKINETKPVSYVEAYRQSLEIQKSSPEAASIYLLIASVKYCRVKSSELSPAK